MRFKKIALFVGVIAMLVSISAQSFAAEWNVVRPEGVPEDFPNKEIEWVYPFDMGSIIDVYFRALGEKIREKEGWSRGFVVMQKPGAGGDIGWTAWAEAKPDGYTIGFAPTAMLLPAIARGRPYRADNVDFVFTMMTDPGVIGVGADSPYNTLQELVEAAKANPGTISVGVTSTIGQEGLTIKQIQNATGAQFNLVPFDGGVEVLTAIAGGHMDAFCLNVGDCAAFLEEGSIKVLATGAVERSEFLPDVPTYQECGYDVIQANSRALGAPKGTPEPILQYLSNCFVAAANDPDVKKQMENVQIPYDTKDRAETTEAFAGFYKGLEELWSVQPWE